MQQFHNIVTCLWVEIACRFVGKYHLRTIEQSTSNDHALLFSARKCVWHSPSFCFHTDQSQNFSDSFLALLLRLPSCSFQHEVQVIVDRSVGQQPEVLKDDSKVASKVRYLTALYLFEIVIKYSRIAIGNRQFGIYGLEERALAGSHLSDQIDEFTFFYSEVDIVEESLCFSFDGYRGIADHSKIIIDK